MQLLRKPVSIKKFLTMKPFILVFFAILAIFSSSCKQCDPPTLIQLVPISEENLAMLPYKKCDTLTLVHSGGKIIKFAIEQTSSKEQTYCEDYCCDTNYEYEVIRTFLQPDYPIFDIEFYMTGFESNQVQLSVSMGNSSMIIPTIDITREYYQAKDSVFIGNTWYRSVYCLKTYTDSYVQNGFEIYPDSLFYNYTEGILQIKMTNNETFTLSR